MKGGLSETGRYLLVKGGYFYRPNAQGYTANLHDAGQYDEDEARAHVARSSGEVSMIPSPKWRPPTDLARLLLDLCLDWDGSQMSDGSPLRTEMTCGLAREIAAALAEQDGGERR